VRPGLAPSLRGPERPAWLVSFADLIALMLAFFVLLYAMQRVEHQGWEGLIQSLSRTLRPDLSHQMRQPPVDENVETVRRSRAINLAYLEALLRGHQAEDGVLEGTLLRRRDENLVIMLPGDLLFQPGAAVPIAAAGARLSGLASVLRNFTNRIDIYGHSDPGPLRNPRFTSRWELSLARAEVVAGQLRKFGYRRPIVVFGLADTRFAELAPIRSATRRDRLARRIDIVVRPTRNDVR
jgi:chemotaxis protein MotB